MRIVRYYPRALTGDGGMTNAVRQWSSYAARAGAEVTMAFDRGVPPAEPNGVRWQAVRHEGPDALRVPCDLEQALDGADVLVLHSAWALHNVRAAEVARRLGVPYLLEPRGAYDPHIVRRKRLLKAAWWHVWERALVTNAAAIHVFFEPERAHLEALGYHGDVVVAPNGIVPPRDVTWDGGSGGYVLWMGRFDPEHKGLDLLLGALALLPPGERPSLRLHGPDYRLGGGNEAVRRMVEQLAIGDAVAIGEPVHGTAKWELLSRAIGFVYPSRWEAFGNSVAEAAALGVPTLTTPYPFGQFLAARGGAFVADANPAALAEGLRALRSPAARATGGRGARVVRECMPWDIVTRSWLEQTEAVLSRRGHRAGGAPASRPPASAGGQ